MNPDRALQLSHAHKERFKGWIVKRIAVNRSLDLDAERAKFHHAVQLDHGRIRVMHRKRGGESPEPLRIPARQLCHAVVRELYHFGCRLRVGESPREMHAWNRIQYLGVIPETIHD